MIYVATGALVMEFGPGGRETLEARPGDFLYVAPGAVHRESNPTQDESHIIVVRSGSGEAVINVDGPEAPTEPARLNAPILTPWAGWRRAASAP